MAEECLTCHAEIDWCVKFPEEVNDKGMPKTIPVNHDSWDNPKGTIAAWRGEALPLRDGQPGPSIIYARYITKREPFKEGTEHRGISHFSTCKQASQWRGRPRSSPDNPGRPGTTPEEPGRDEENLAATDPYMQTLLRMGSHLDCEMQQVGRCVYCVPHKVRIGQGRIPNAADRAEIRAALAELGAHQRSTSQAAGLAQLMPMPPERWPSGSNGAAANR